MYDKLDVYMYKVNDVDVPSDDVSMDVCMYTWMYVVSRRVMLVVYLNVCMLRWMYDVVQSVCSRCTYSDFAIDVCSNQMYDVDCHCADVTMYVRL